MKILGNIVGLVAVLPGVQCLLKRLAVLPVALKTRWFERLFAAVARRTAIGESLLETNLGIDDSLRVRIPSRKVQLIFGRPQNYLPERATLELARHLAKHVGSFVDIGANEGLFSLAIAMDCPDRSAAGIHVFEPDSDLVKRLADNFRRNGIHAKLNHAAVGSASGSATFYRNISDDLSGSLSDLFSKSHELLPTTVEVTTLTDYFQREGISNACVKVDVEGAGAEVWQGARGCIQDIDFLVYEILEPEVKALLPARVIAEGNYQGYYIRDFDLVASLDGEFDYVAPFYNWLFCRYDPAALQALLHGTNFRVLRSES
jgi:FkbM family methyltransferase